MASPNVEVLKLFIVLTLSNWIVESQLQFPDLYNSPYFQQSQGQQTQRRALPYPYGGFYQEGNVDASPYRHLNSLFQGQVPYDNQGIQYSNQNSFSPNLNQIPYSQSQLSSQRISAHPNLLPTDEAEIVRGGFSVKNGSYMLEWEVTSPSTITFKARRRGVGFVGFAISPSGGMSGADIFIAGVDPTGMPFANDYHHVYQAGGIGAAYPDASNDYQVLGVSESQGYTTVRFRRLLDTLDSQDDHAIINAEQNILWSMGPPSRGLEYHGPTNRGLVKINLLDPPPRFRLRRPII